MRDEEGNSARERKRIDVAVRYLARRSLTEGAVRIGGATRRVGTQRQQARKGKKERGDRRLVRAREKNGSDGGKGEDVKRGREREM